VNTRSIIRKTTIITTITGLLAVIAYLLIVFFPSPLFTYELRAGNLVIHSDTAFDAAGGRAFLERVRERLETSPLNDTNVRHDIYLCDTRWRRILFFLPCERAGGLHYFLSHNAFLSGGSVADDLLRSPAGIWVRDGRPLSYFAAHEITHTLCEDSVGIAKYCAMPDWIKEGYADNVGRGSALKMPGMREAFLTDAATMREPAAAPYLRYNVLVAYCLEIRGLSVRDLLSSGMSQEEAETLARESLKQ
jgi:hypothetical protein